MLKRTLIVLLLVAGALPACSPQREALTVYSGRTENLIRPLLEKFSKQAGVPIDVRYGNSADLALLIAEEGDRTPADVFLSQSPGAVGHLASLGRLATLQDSTLELVPDRYRSERKLWVGTSARQRVLVYNSKLTDEDSLPRSVFDVTADRFRGQLGIAPQNASFQDFVTAMRSLSGEQRTQEWLNALKRNDARIYPNNNAIVEAAGRGEVTFGLVNHYYNVRFLHENPSLPTRNASFADDDPGSLLLVSTASVLKRTKRHADADRLIAFLLGAEAQKYFADTTFEYPIVDGVEPPQGLAPLGTIGHPTYSFDDLGEGFRKTTEMIEASGLSQ